MSTLTHPLQHISGKNHDRHVRRSWRHCQHWRQSNHQPPLCWWHRWLSRRGKRTEKISWASRQSLHNRFSNVASISVWNKRVLQLWEGKKKRMCYLQCPRAVVVWGCQHPSWAPWGQSPHRSERQGQGQSPKYMRSRRWQVSRQYYTVSCVVFAKTPHPYPHPSPDDPRIYRGHHMSSRY